MGGNGSKTYEEAHLSGNPPPMQPEIHIDRSDEAFRLTKDKGAQKFLVEMSKMGKWLKVSTEDGKLVFKQTVESHFHSRSVTHAPDSTNDNQEAEQEHPTREICVAFDKMGFGKCTTSLFRRDLPAYEGQEPTPKKQSKKGKHENERHDHEFKGDGHGELLVGDEESSGDEVKMYKVAEIGARHGLGDSSARYKLVTGPPIVRDKKDVNKGEETNTLLVAERLTMMKFRAIVKSYVEGADPYAGEVVAKCVQANKLATKFEVEVAPGQDVIAVVSMFLAVAGDGGSAGALAGAGVI